MDWCGSEEKNLGFKFALTIGALELEPMAILAHSWLSSCQALATVEAGGTVTKMCTVHFNYGKKGRATGYLTDT